MKTTRYLLKQLGAQIGLPALKFSDEGICELVLPDGAEFFLEGDPDGAILHLNGVVGYLHAPGAEVLSLLLSANHNGQATGAAALALHAGNPAEVLLTQRVDVSLISVAQFIASLEEFLKVLAFWIDYLPQARAGQTAALAADALSRRAGDGHVMHV